VLDRRLAQDCNVSRWPLYVLAAFNDCGSVDHLHQMGHLRCLVAQVRWLAIAIDRNEMSGRERAVADEQRPISSCVPLGSGPARLLCSPPLVGNCTRFFCYHYYFPPSIFPLQPTVTSDTEGLAPSLIRSLRRTLFSNSAPSLTRAVTSTSSIGTRSGSDAGIERAKKHFASS